MDEAARILKLIESVDKNTPETALDEIDARVDAYRFGHAFEKMARGVHQPAEYFVSVVRNGRPLHVQRQAATRVRVMR